MNSWASAAAKQLFQTWTRSGVAYLPKPTPDGTQRAVSWLEDQQLQLGVEEAARLGLHGSPSQSREPSNESLQASKAPPLPSTPTAPPTAQAPSIVTPQPPATLPSTVSPPTAPKPVSALLASPKHWGTSPQEAASRSERFRLLAQQVGACKLCSDIACRRNQTVFGAGPNNARILMFGEAPGAEEDRSGEPFVGAAGQLMDKILVASGLQRNEVYIMNALKCRPPNNRTPTDSEIENCRPFFEAQLETIQPEYIICWGAVAVRALLNSKESIGRLRGKFHHYKGAKVLVTYHPAYLLRNPDAKKLTWEDMKLLMKELGIPIPQPKKPN